MKKVIDKPLKKCYNKLSKEIKKRKELMIMTKKITKREMFAMISAVVEKAEVENKDEMLNALAHEIELLDNKKSNSKPSARERENEALKEEIFAELKEIGRAVTVSEFQAETRFAPPEFSNQRMSALLNQLVKADRVHKEIIKKKSYFSVVAE